MARKKASGLFGGIDFGTKSRRGKKSKSMASLFTTRKKKGRKAKSMASLFSSKSKRGRKSSGLFGSMNFDWGKSSSGGFGGSGLFGGMFGFGGSSGRIDEYSPTWDGMRDYLRAHDMSPYNRQAILYYILHMPTTEDARALVDDIASRGRSLASSGQMVDKASWAYEQWKEYKGNSAFMTVTNDLATGKLSLDEARSLIGGYLTEATRGVLFYLQDVSEKRR